MISTAASSTTPPPTPRDQAPLPVWPVLRGYPVPEALLADRVWLEPPRRGRWAAALRRLVGRRDAATAAPSAPTRPATPAPAPAAAPVVGDADEGERPMQEAA